MFKIDAQRARTTDKEATPILTVERIGLKRSKTPEGFLLCEDVPLARTGLTLYGPQETPIKPGTDGIARVTRDAAALFAPETIASFMGKALCDEHPPVDVTPQNWKQYAKGIVLNPRRGTQDDADVILADILVTDAALIRDIEAGRREVSAGYEADYEPIGAGLGRQLNIIGNHVALVERGRCGPRCAIGDHQPPSLKEHSTMGTQTTSGVSRTRREIPEAVRRLFRDAAEALADDQGLGMDGDGGTTDIPDDSGNHTHIHIHTDGAGGGGGGAPAAPVADDTDGLMPDAGGLPDEGMGGDPGMDMGGGGDLESRVAAIEGTLQQIMQMLQGGGEAEPDGDEMPMGDDTGEDAGAPASDTGAGEEEPPPTTRDSRMKTGDSAALSTAYQMLVSDAEILVPGYRFPTFDAAKPRRITLDSMCAQRRRILDHMGATVDGRALLDNVAGKDVDVSAMGCADAAVIFKAAAGAKRMMNNQTATRDAGTVRNVNAQPVGKIQSIGDLNKANQAFWAKQAAQQRAAK